MVACAWMLVWWCLSVFMRLAPEVLPAVLCLHEIVALIALPWLAFLKPLSFSPTPLVHRINSFLNTCGWSRTYGLSFKCNSPVDPLQFLKVYLQHHHRFCASERNSEDRKSLAGQVERDHVSGRLLLKPAFMITEKGKIHLK